MPNQTGESVKHDIESQIVEMWPTDAVGGRSTHLRGNVDAISFLLHGLVSVSPQAMVVVQDTDSPNIVSAPLQICLDDLAILLRAG